MIISYENSVVKKEKTHLEFPFREASSIHGTNAAFGFSTSRTLNRCSFSIFYDTCDGHARLMYFYSFYLQTHTFTLTMYLLRFISYF